MASYSDYSYDHHNWSDFSFSSEFMQYDFHIRNPDRIRLYASCLAFQIVLVAVGILGNYLLLYSIAAFRPIRQSVRHIYLANMAAAGSFYLVLFGIPNLYFCGRFLNGATHLPLSPFLYLLSIETISGTVVAFMVAALAIDEYLVTVSPVTAARIRSPKSALIVCIVSWIVGVITTIVACLLPGSALDVTICYSVFAALIYVTPVVISATCYTCVYCNLRNDQSQPSTVDSSVTFQRLSDGDSEFSGRRVMLPRTSSLAVSFAIFWLFSHALHLVIYVIWLVHGFTHPFWANGKEDILIQMSDVAVHFNIALNPVLILACNPDFREHVMRVLYTATCCRRRPIVNDSRAATA